MSEHSPGPPLLETSLTGVRQVRAAVARPRGMVEGTRWLFWLLATISLALSAPAPFVNGRGPMVPVAALTIALLAASLMFGYLTRQARLGLDLLDAACLFGLACSGPTPAGVFALTFAMIWFRSLYGSTGAALLRCVLYGTALSATLFVWPLLPGNGGAGETPMVMASIPTMFVTVVAARHLAGILREREQGARRDAIQAASGVQLLRVADADSIRRIARQAVFDICAVTPGLRVLYLRNVDDGLEVLGHAGPFTAAPSALSARTRAQLAPGAEDDVVRDVGELDTAVGCACTWQSLQLLDPTNGSWLVLGSPRRLPHQVIDTLTRVATQMVLAMRNSQAHQELTIQATLDSLTGLANRALFNRELSAALAGARGTETAVLFVDLDDFKDVNDAFGHSAGDELLREVALRIAAATRSGDLCSRLGGDEFAVLLPRTGAVEATDIGRRIVDAVGGLIELTSGVAQVGASVGLAVDACDSTPEQLVQRADIAMYAAKAGGKGRMQLFTDGLLQDGSDNAAFDRQLGSATANDELVVHYQPVVSLPDGRCTAVEALVRWQHSGRGLLLPADFIAAAERTGAIRDIGRFVLRRACADASGWRESHDGPKPAMHVNISALQLDDERFCADVLQCLEDFSLPADQLVLEITETMVISSRTAIGKLNELAEHGVVIAIDDFGTGYSALTTLRSLPVSIVKIDASFVAGSTVNPRDRAVTEAIVQMASRMGMRTIAEGVERPDQQALLESIGADAAQGYLFLRPAPAADLVRWLDGRRPVPSVPDDVVVPFPQRHSIAKT